MAADPKSIELGKLYNVIFVSWPEGGCYGKQMEQQKKGRDFNKVKHFCKLKKRGTGANLTCRWP